MAVCNCCNRDMMDTYGCNYRPIVHHGKKYRPIKAGDPGDFYFDEKSGRCGDCGAVAGHYHHVGCDLQRCPICGNQLISCGCNDADNLYIPMSYDTAPIALSEVIDRARKNISLIRFIDQEQKTSTPEPWFRFLLVKVTSFPETYAVYQITKVTKTYCDLTAISVSGLDHNLLQEKFPHFQFDHIFQEWGMQQQVRRSHVDKLLAAQDKKGDTWISILQELGVQHKVLQNIETFYAAQTNTSGEYVKPAFCPRCGKRTMASDPLHNALSRHATVYICDTCGTDEALRDWKQIPLPLKNWACAPQADSAQ